MPISGKESAVCCRSSSPRNNEAKRAPNCSYRSHAALVAFFDSPHKIINSQSFGVVSAHRTRCSVVVSIASVYDESENHHGPELRTVLRMTLTSVVY